MKECKIADEVERILCQSKSTCLVAERMRREDVLSLAQQNPLNAWKVSERHLVDLQKYRGCIKLREVIEEETRKARAIEELINPKRDSKSLLI